HGFFRKGRWPFHCRDENAISADDGARKAWTFGAAATERRLPQDVLSALATPRERHIRVIGIAQSRWTSPTGPVPGKRHPSHAENDPCPGGCGPRETAWAHEAPHKMGSFESRVGGQA